MIYPFIALLTIAVSAGLGAYLELVVGYQESAIHWLIGAIGGIIAGFFATYGALRL